MNIDISISRKGVMGIVEGISVTIAQHNNGTPTFEQLWASDNESPKLDIYYREGIGDLERQLEKWIRTSSGQFDLQAAGEDYTLTLDLNDSWPEKLKGLLSNKVQDYLVHAVTAGWLNDFDGISTKQDYQTMAANDLTDIVYILGLKEFSFDEAERGKDDDAALKGSTQNASGERAADAEKESDSQEAEAGARATDDDVALKGSTQNQAEVRASDAEKASDTNAASAEGRHDKDDVAADVASAQNEAGGRNEDNTEIMIPRDYTDWSGIGVPFFPMDVLRQRLIMTGGRHYPLP